MFEQTLRFVSLSLNRQKQIVAKVDRLKEETQRLDTLSKQKLAALAELKQSILQKAFADELTTLPEKEFDEAVA